MKRYIEVERDPFRRIYSKYLHDVRTLMGVLPAESKRLSELLSSARPQIRLRDGSMHTMDVEELRRLGSELPWYLHSLVKLPIIVAKNGDSFTVIGDKWTIRAVEYVLGRGLRYEPDAEIDAGDLGVLLKRYKTLIFITILSLEKGVRDEGDSEAA